MDVKKTIDFAKLLKCIDFTTRRCIIVSMNISTYQSGGYATMSEQERAKIDQFITWLLEHPEKIPVAEQALDLK